MSPRKLTAADKKAIVSTYRSSGESTTALADRYGVSTSTISRLLKNNIPEDEYDSLISDKRTQRGESEEEIPLEIQVALAENTASTPSDFSASGNVEEITPEIPRLRVAAIPTGNRRVRRRSSASEEEESLEQTTKSGAPKPITRAQKYSVDSPVIDALITFDQFTETDGEESPASLPPVILPVTSSIPTSYFDQTPPKSPAPKVVIQKSLPRLASNADLAAEPPDSITYGASEAITYGASEAIADMQQDLSVVAGIFGEEMSDLLDDDDDDLPDEEGWTERIIPALVAPEMQVLPLASATLPRTCYIVVDKFAELVACPLRDFVELGKVNGDAPQNTLPVFDSQRVAKRFSNNRNQRVIKVPDSGVFYKTIDHLLAKGISLMLVDGRIYSLK
jgi:transposase-like protein